MQNSSIKKQNKLANITSIKKLPNKEQVFGLVAKASSTVHPSMA